MTNTRPRLPMDDVLHQPRTADIACAESPDVCELLFAELEARRVTLQKLLHLVRLEAESVPAGRVPILTRARCSNGRVKRTAQPNDSATCAPAIPAPLAA